MMKIVQFRDACTCTHIVYVEILARLKFVILS